MYRTLVTCDPRVYQTSSGRLTLGSHERHEHPRKGTLQWNIHLRFQLLTSLMLICDDLTFVPPTVVALIRHKIPAAQLCTNFIWQPFHEGQSFPRDLASPEEVRTPAGAAVLLSAALSVLTLLYCVYFLCICLRLCFSPLCFSAASRHITTACRKTFAGASVDSRISL